MDPSSYLCRAWQALHHEGMDLATRVILPVLRPLLGPLDEAPERIRYAPIFIVGVPRSGSTFLYQLLTHRFDVLYIDNLACRWHRDLRVGMGLSAWLYGSRPHGSFESRLGATSGGHAPSECGGLWYRWLPREDHFAPGPVSTKITLAIRAELATVSRRHGKPWVIKNLHMGQRLRLISQAIPEARIIRIIRDPAQVVASILDARSALRIPPGRFWSTRPPRWREMLSLAPVDMVATQVVALEQQIEHDLALFPQNQVMAVRYPDLVERDVSGLAEFLGAGYRDGELHSPIAFKSKRSPAATAGDITRAIELARQSSLVEPIHFR